jgi:hypothetical protein
MAVGEFFAIIVKAVYYVLWFAWMVVWAPSRFLGVSAWSFCDRLRYNQAMNGFYLTPVPAVASASVAPKAASEVRYPVQECRIVSAEPDPPPVPYQASASATSRNAPPALAGASEPEEEEKNPGAHPGIETACGKKNPKDRRINKGTVRNGSCSCDFRPAKVVQVFIRHGEMMEHRSVPVPPGAGEFHCPYCLEPIAQIATADAAFVRFCPLCKRRVFEDFLHVHPLLLNERHLAMLLLGELRYQLRQTNKCIEELVGQLKDTKDPSDREGGLLWLADMRGHFSKINAEYEYLQENLVEADEGDPTGARTALRLLRRVKGDDMVLDTDIKKYARVRRLIARLYRKRAPNTEIVKFQSRLVDKYFISRDDRVSAYETLCRRFETFANRRKAQVETY